MFGFALSLILSAGGIGAGLIAVAAGIYLGSRALAIGGGCACALAVAFTLGGQVARAESNEAALRARLETDEADLHNAQAAAQRDSQAVVRLTETDTANRQRLDEYARTLDGRDVCTISDDDVRRLRELGGDNPRPTAPTPRTVVPPGSRTPSPSTR